MNKKIAFVVVALVVLVATFCVSFAGMPVNKIGTVDLTLPLSDLVIPSSWQGDLYIDLTLAQDYASDLYNADIDLWFTSPSGGISAFYTVDGVDWTAVEMPIFGFTIEASELGFEQYEVSSLVGFGEVGYERVNEGGFRYSLPSDITFTIYVDGDAIPADQMPSSLPSPVFDFMVFVPSVVPSLGQIVIDNIIDTLWGTVVSVGDSFGEGLNQMVGDLFFDLETGDLSAFSIVIICFFALCLLVTIVNWLFFRLTNIKKF